MIFHPGHPYKALWHLLNNKWPVKQLLKAEESYQLVIVMLVYRPMSFVTEFSDKNWQHRTNLLPDSGMGKLDNFLGKRGGYVTWLWL